MTREQAKVLVEKYNQGLASKEEKTWLENWYMQKSDQLFLDDSDIDFHQIEAELRTRTFDYAGLKDEPLGLRRTSLWPRYLGIAAAVIGLAIGVYFFTAPRHPELVSGSPNYANDIAPGKNTATLTDNQGKTITLSEAKTGVIFDNNKLTYNDGTTIDPSSLGMTNGDSRALQVSTPKGGTYSIILQDGTKVWLNADSKLEFESNYRNKLQRIVKLTGEGYFEVAKVFSPGERGRGPERVPFIVESNGQRVEVLGTHFNISAYKGEAIRTTLLEGSVRVASLTPSGRGAVGGEGKVILKPNQQAILSDNGIKCILVDANEAIAWKNGKFLFAKEDIKSIMRKIGRWYDVEVVYEGDVENKALLGSVSRFTNVSEVLEMLAATKAVKFKIEGRKITVMPYKN